MQTNSAIELHYVICYSVVEQSSVCLQPSTEDCGPLFVRSAILKVYCTYL